MCAAPVVTSELVMLSLDLVKTRLSVMSMEMRKNFIQVILTSLIEKSTDPKILRAVVKIVEEWVKNNSPMAANQVGVKWTVEYAGKPKTNQRMESCHRAGFVSGNRNRFRRCKTF